MTPLYSPKIRISINVRFGRLAKLTKPDWEDLYQDIASKIKWFGGLSDSFPINQGVRQGAISLPICIK